MPNKRLLTVFLTAILVFSGYLYLSAQISITPRTNENNISQSDDYLRRNLKTVRSLIKIGNYERALEILVSLEEKYGRLPEISSELKRVYREQKDYVSLRAFIFEELQADPDSFYLVCQLGEINFLIDSLESALSTWERAFRMAGRSKYNYILLAGYYLGYGFYDEAVSVYRRARIILNDPLLFSRELSDIYISQRSYKEAIGEYLSLLKYEPDKVNQIFRQIITIFSEADNPDEIERMITQIVREEPDNPGLYIILGDVNVLNKNLPAAFDNFKRADLLSDSSGKYLFHFINLCFSNHEYEMTVEAADYYLQNINSDKEAQVKLVKARGLVQLGSYQSALDILKQIENSTGDRKTRTEAILIAGEIYAVKLKDIKSAKLQFTRVAENQRLNHLSQLASIRLAELNIMEGDFDQASSLLDKLATNNRYEDVTEKAMFLQARIAFYSYDFENAEKEYSKLTRKYPTGFFVNNCLDYLAVITEAKDDTVLYFIANAGRCYYSGNIDSAITTLEQAEKSSNSDVLEYVIFKLANYYAEIEHWEDAISTYERYNSSFPEGLFIDRSLYYLAVIYYEDNSQPEKSDELLNKIITDHPTSPLIEKTRLYLNKIKSI